MKTHKLNPSKDDKTFCSRDASGLFIAESDPTCMMCGLRESKYLAKKVRTAFLKKKPQKKIFKQAMKYIRVRTGHGDLFYPASSVASHLATQKSMGLNPDEAVSVFDEWYKKAMSFDDILIGHFMKGYPRNKILEYIEFFPAKAFLDSELADFTKLSQAAIIISDERIKKEPEDGKEKKQSK